MVGQVQSREYGSSALFDAFDYSPSELQSVRAVWFVERETCSFRFVKLENELEHEKTVLEERLEVNLDWFE